MKRMLLLLTLSFATAQAEDHAQHHSLPPAGDAQIVITINPEARVSVVRGEPLAAAPCGSPAVLNVRVINQGFVTAPLRAILIGERNPPIALHMDATNLSGERNESRTLHLTPLEPELIDVTIAFSIDNNIGDFGGRDRVHFLVRCVPQHRPQGLPLD